MGIQVIELPLDTGESTELAVMSVYVLFGLQSLVQQ